MNREAQVSQFHLAAGIPNSKNKIEQIHQQWNRVIEEFQELSDEIAIYAENNSIENHAALLKELCDAQYVLSGLVERLGWSDIFEHAFERVHENNMSKVVGSAVVDMDGKVLKPEGYKKVVLQDLLQ